MAEYLQGPILYLAYIAGWGVGLGFGSCIGAMCLRLALKFLEFPVVAYGRSFVVTLIANVCTCGVYFAIGFNVRWMSQMDLELQGGRQQGNYRYFANFANPTFSFYLVVLGLLIIACAYRRLLFRSEEISDAGSRVNVTFGDSFILACFSQAIGAIFLGLMAVLVLLGIVAINSVLNPV